jgi:subtilisin family serine protease
MTHRAASLALCTCLLGISPGHAQDRMLAPPDGHYFQSKKSWGKDLADQWGLHRIGFDASPQSAWRLVKADAQPVIVAIVDSGLDWNHKHISWNSLWRNPKELVGNGVDDDKNRYVDDVIGWDFLDHNNLPWDYDGHGTFVAGIIAGDWNEKSGLAGVNPLARLMILRAINDFGHTRASVVAEAIAYAADNGARVINLSLGGKRLTTVERAAIDYAFGKGAVIVVAAGNQGADISDYGIASSDKVLAVAATGSDDQRAKFSNWGKIAVAAPGTDILSLRARRTDTMLGVDLAKYKPGTNFVGDDKRFYRADGTSFAAPLVSGLASLMIANDPGLTNVQVMNIIKSTARDVGLPGVDQYTGYGMIDARAALKAPRDFRLLAGIDKLGVVQVGGKPAVRVTGIADADQLKAVRLEVGRGETPKDWKAVGAAKQAAQSGNEIGDIPAAALAGAKVWQVRLVVEHQNGSRREARYRLSLN